MSYQSVAIMLCLEYIRFYGSRVIKSGNAKSFKALNCILYDVLEARKRMKCKAEPRIGWWKLKKENCSVKSSGFRANVLDGDEGELQKIGSFTTKIKRTSIDWPNRSAVEDVQQVGVIRNVDRNVLTNRKSIEKMKRVF